MKLKHTNLLFIAIFSAFLFSCATTSKKSAAPTTPDLSSMTEEELAEFEKQEAIDEMFSLSWTKNASKKVDATYGNVRLRATKSFGSFNIGIVNSNGKTIPALSTSNEYTSSSFYLKAGKKVIKLNQNSLTQAYARKTENGMQIAYVIDGLASVVLDFYCFSPDPKVMDINTVKITAGVKNLSKKREEFALKMVFDTVLGETDRHHFYDENALPIKSEREIRNIKSSQWFVSQNARGSMLFTFAGLEATVPTLVEIANYNTLENAGWIPNMLDYRAFDTVLSYNNSAVGAIWEGKKLSVGDVFTEVFYVTLSDEDKRVTQNPLINGDDVSDNNYNSQSQNKVESKKENQNNQVSQNQNQNKKDDDVKPQNQNQNIKTETSNQNQQNNQNAQVSKPKEEVKEEKKETSKNTYSDDYIKSLLQRIDMLKEDGSANAAEIEALNYELDLILQYMVK